MGYGFLSEMKGYGCLVVLFSMFRVRVPGFFMLEFLGLDGSYGLWLELIFVWVFGFLRSNHELMGFDSSRGVLSEMTKRYGE